MSYNKSNPYYTSSKVVAEENKKHRSSAEHMERCKRLQLEAQYIQLELKKRQQELSMKQKRAENQVMAIQKRKARIQQIVDQSNEQPSPVSPSSPPSPSPPPSTPPLPPLPTTPPEEAKRELVPESRRQSSTVSGTEEAGGGGGGGGGGSSDMKGSIKTEPTTEVSTETERRPSTSAFFSPPKTTATSSASSSSSFSSSSGAPRKVYTDEDFKQNKTCYPDENDDFTNDPSLLMPRPPELTGDDDVDRQLINEFSTRCERIRAQRKREILQKRQQQLNTIHNRVTEIANEVKGIEGDDFVYKWTFTQNEKAKVKELKGKLDSLQRDISSFQTSALVSTRPVLEVQGRAISLEQDYATVVSLYSKKKKDQEEADKTKRDVVFAKELSPEDRLRIVQRAREDYLQSTQSGKIMLWFRVRVLKRQPYHHPAEDQSVSDWCTSDGKRLIKRIRPEREMENKLDMFILDKTRVGDGGYGYPADVYKDAEEKIKQWGEERKGTGKKGKVCTTPRTGVRIFIQSYDRFRPQQTYAPGEIVQAFADKHHLFKFSCYYSPLYNPTPNQEMIYRKMYPLPPEQNEQLNAGQDEEEENENKRIKERSRHRMLFYTNTEPLYVNGFFAYKPNLVFLPRQKYIFQNKVYQYVGDPNSRRTTLRLPTETERHNEDWVFLQDNAQEYQVNNPASTFPLFRKGKSVNDNREALFCFNDRVQTQDDSVLRFKTGLTKQEMDKELKQYQDEFYQKVMEPHLIAQSAKYKDNDPTPNLSFLMYGPSGTGKSYTTEYFVQRAWEHMLADVKQREDKSDVLCIQSFDFDDVGVHDLFDPRPVFATETPDTVKVASKNTTLKFPPDTKEDDNDDTSSKQMPAFLDFTSLRTTLSNFGGEVDKQFVTYTNEKIGNNFASVMKWIKLSRNQMPTYRNPSGSSRSHLVYRLFYLPSSSISDRPFINKDALSPHSSVFIIDLAGFENVEAIRSGGGPLYYQLFPAFINGVRAEWIKQQQQLKLKSEDASSRSKSPSRRDQESMFDPKPEAKKSVDFARDITMQLGKQSEFITDSLSNINQIVENTKKPYTGPIKITAGGKNPVEIFGVAMKNIMRHGTIVTIVACLSPSLADYESTIETIQRMEDWQDIATTG